jgi:hypothetical protein
MKYERQSDRDEEARIAAILSTAWNCSVRKMPERYTLDYAAIRDGQMVAALEIKRRHRGINQFGEVFINLNKVIAARSFEHLGVKCFFVVQFNDCLAYADLAPKRRIEFRGREDRGDWQDQQPIVCISSTEFKIIESVEAKQKEKESVT